MAAVQKRKREAHDLPGARPAPAMTAPVPVGTEFDQQYLHAVDDGSGTTNDMGLDFGSLAPADADAADPAEPPASTPTPGRAGVAATAVMARYHTMKVPQSTEQAFVQKAEHGTSAAAAAGSGNGGDRPPSSSGMGGEGGDARAGEHPGGCARRHADGDGAAQRPQAVSATLTPAAHGGARRRARCRSTRSHRPSPAWAPTSGTKCAKTTTKRVRIGIPRSHPH